MRKNLLFVVFAFSIIFLFSFENASACSCTGKDSPCAEYKDADLLFVGTVSKITTVKDKFAYSYNAKFQVENLLKGINIKRKEIEVQTSTQGTACGYRFQEGRTYLVYAYLDEETNIYETSICTRIRFLDYGKVDDEVEVLSSIAKGKLEPRIYGTVYETVREIGIRSVNYQTGEETRPIAGVKVIAQSNGKNYESISDTNGKYSIKNLKSGKYKLKFVIPPTHKLGGDNWDDDTEDWYKKLEVEFAENDCPDRLNIYTRVDGRIKGRLFDEQGKPVGKDFRVSLVTESTAKEEVGDMDAVPAYTDENGYYEFYGIPQGRYYLGLNLDFKPNKDYPYPRTYFPNENDISKASIIVLSKAEKLSGMDLYLPQKVVEIELKGKVIDANGKPIKGAIVERYGLYYGKLKDTDSYRLRSIKQPTFEGRVETDANGEFTLKLLKGNKYNIHAYLEKEDSYENLLEGEDIDIEVNENIKPIILVLDKKPK